MKRSTIAPTVATIMLPSSPPPAEAPRVLKSQPPRKAPITPTTRSPMRPKPPPLTSIPANQPATRPTIRNHRKLISLPPLSREHDERRPVEAGNMTNTNLRDIGPRAYQKHRHDRDRLVIMPRHRPICWQAIGPGLSKTHPARPAKRGLDPDKWFINVEIVVGEEIGTETTTY